MPLTELIELFSPSTYWDVSGSFYSPALERGGDNVPALVELPSKADMLSLSTSELYSVGTRYGYIAPAEMRIQHLEGFNLRPGDPRYERAMERLKANMRPAILGNARRMATRHETLRSVNGNTKQRMIYLNESAEPCEECEPLGGTEKTYAEFVTDGDLPGDRCLGVNYCLCTAMATGYG